MISFNFKNESFCSWKSDSQKEIIDLLGEFSFFIPGYQYTPVFKAGRWDGKIHLLKRTGFGLGLIKKVLEYCKKKNYSYELDSTLKEKLSNKNNGEDIQEVLDFFSGYLFYHNMEQIFPRKDQMAAVVRACLNDRVVNICPTSFGKSLCIFMSILWNIHGPREIKKNLIIVPTKELVLQFENDIIDYCNKDVMVTPSWFPKIQTLYSGQDKKLNSKTNIMITTWQSLISILKESPGYVNQFGCVILDEAHKSNGKSITECLNSGTKVKYRYGWTGSLKDSSLNELQAEAIIGPVKVITTTKKLMDEKIVAQLKIKPVVIEHEVDFYDYNSEIQYLEKLEERNKTIIDIALNEKRTGLILFRHLKHGQKLYDMIREKKTDAILIDGNQVVFNGVSYKTYQELKHMIEKSEKLVLVCSTGVFQVGVSIKNINWILFGCPVKSFVAVVQSIGRGLRLSPTKQNITLFDLADKTKYAWRHFKERMKIYKESKFYVEY